MDILRSSIFGKEFINYRKHTSESERKRYVRKTFMEDKIPVIIDSVDENIKDIFIKKVFVNNSRIIVWGLELQMEKNARIRDILKEIKIELVKKEKEHIFMEGELRIGLEDGTIINDENELVIDVYKRNKNVKDNILYILVTQETTMYNYIMSIIRHIWKYFV